MSMFLFQQVEHHCRQRHLTEPTLVKDVGLSVAVGRAILRRTRPQTVSLQRSAGSKFSFTRPVMILLERIAVAVSNNEPVLLVGETGTGKTSAVQYLAEMMCRRQD